MSRLKNVAAGSLAVAALTMAMASPASADAGKPGQSMTHMKTIAGLASTLEAAGVVLYTKGGATSAAIGDSLASPQGQVMFHVPITNSKNTVKHVGSTLVLFNTTNDRLVELRNPVIDLRSGAVRAGVGTGPVSTVFTITNVKSLKPVVKTDSATGIRTTTYTGAQLSFAPGIAGAVVDGLGLPAGSLADGTAFATADVTLQSAS